jgi:excisionase family DNA binding protein
MDNPAGGNPNLNTENAQADLDEGLHVGFVEVEEFEERARTETHRHGRRGVPGQHIDLAAEEYTPDEIARLLGTSKDVVMHAIRSGELRAERAGHDIVCIKHEEVVDWLRRRGPGV